MDNTQKLAADIERTKKHYRAEHSSNYDCIEVCRQIVEMFANNNKSLFDLAHSFGDYWIDEYIAKSNEVNNEPTAQSIDKLCAMQNVLDNENETKCLTKKDWQELCQCTNDLSEELPIEILNDLMAMFLDHQAF